jgi:hypothetical protein
MITITFEYSKIKDDKNNLFLFVELKCDVRDANNHPDIFEKINKNIYLFFEKYNIIKVDKKTFKINYWFFNFLLFIFSKYDNITIDNNTRNISIKTEYDNFTLLDDISNIIDNNKDIYNWIDNEIENNPKLIKNTYLQNILSDKLKTKYNHLLTAKYFDLI